MVNQAAASLTWVVISITAVAAAPCKSPQLKQGMEYKVARKIALAAGFQTPSLPAYGYSEKDEKVISECSGSVALCNQYPEIESCGSGNCAFSMVDAYGNNLKIITYGEIEDGSAGVTSYSIKCAK